jgi:hypothetical protein
MNFIHNNYLRWSGVGDNWRLEMDKPTRPVRTFYEESIIAAEMIWANKTGELNLLYSGGLDSEFVLALFMSLGMRVKPIIMSIEPYLNRHDIMYAIDYCKTRNIDYTLIELDLPKFLDSGEYLDIATKVGCPTYQRIPTMWLAQQVSGTVITGDCPPILVKRDGTWYSFDEEGLYSFTRCWDFYGIEGTPLFANYTTEMVHAFLLDPTMRELGSDKFYGKETSNSTKYHVYNRGNDFNLIPRIKYHGWEFIERNDIFGHPAVQEVMTTLSSKYSGKIWWPYLDYINDLNHLL